MNLWRVPDGLHRHLVLPSNYGLAEVPVISSDYAYVPVWPWPHGYDGFSTICKIKLSSIPEEP